MKKRIFLLVFNIFLWMNIGVAEVRNISLNFSNTKIRNLIDIVSKVTRKSFIFDEKHLAGKKITLIAQKKFTASEAYAVFEYILKINDLLTINEGKVVRILPSNLARREATPILKANDKSKDNDYVTHIIEAKNTSITQLRSSISQLISKTGTIGVYPPGNLLIIRDLRKNIKRIVKLVQLFDESSGEVQVAIIALKYANARVVLSIVNRIFVQTGRKYSSPSKPVLTLDPRNNRIFVAGNQTAIRKVKKMVAILDQSADEQRKITLVEILHS
ncbi:MAG: general secretion pathway protein D, partial [bacterium]